MFNVLKQFCLKKVVLNIICSSTLFTERNVYKKACLEIVFKRTNRKTKNRQAASLKMGELELRNSNESKSDSITHSSKAKKV